MAKAELGQKNQEVKRFLNLEVSQEVDGGIVVYNPIGEILIDCNDIVLLATEEAEKRGISPKKPGWGRKANGWVLTINNKGNELDTIEMSYVRENWSGVLFNNVWVMKDGVVHHLGTARPDFSFAFSKETPVVFLPVIRSNGKDAGGVLVASQKDLLIFHHRQVIAGFLQRT